MHRISFPAGYESNISLAVGYIKTFKEERGEKAHAEETVRKVLEFSTEYKTETKAKNKSQNSPLFARKN